VRKGPEKVPGLARRSRNSQHWTDEADDETAQIVDMRTRALRADAKAQA
jgi:hypothetical protein